jgi:hypothetical protein
MSEEVTARSQWMDETLATLSRQEFEELVERAIDRRLGVWLTQLTDALLDMSDEDGSTLRPAFAGALRRAMGQARAGQGTDLGAFRERVPRSTVQEPKVEWSVSARSGVKALVEAARALSPLDQLELISALSEVLYRTYPHTYRTEDFWEPKALEQHLQAQQPQPLADVTALRADFWPEEESCDDLIQYIYGQRREDRLNR